MSADLRTRLVAFLGTVAILGGGIAAIVLSDRQAAEQRAATAPAATDASDAVSSAPAPAEATDDPAPADVADGTPPAPDASDTVTAEAPSAAPSIDILRVEPDGSFVIAGAAGPEAAVDILVNGDVLMSTTADANGDWTALGDRLLPPGDHAMTIRATEAERPAARGAAEITIGIDADGATPLVAVAEPGQPSQILQRPEPAPVVVADAEEATTAAQTEPAPADQVQAEPDAEPDTQASRADLAAGTDVAAATDGDAATETANDVTANSDTANDETIAPEASSEDIDTAAAPATAAAPSTEPVADPRRAATVIDLVEVEAPGRVHVTGTTEAGDPVRVYLNGRHVGDARADARGDWQLTFDSELPPGRYTVRADVVEPADGSVVARASVRFDRARVVLADAQETDAAPASGDASEAAVETSVETATETAAQPVVPEPAAATATEGTAAQDVAAAPPPPTTDSTTAGTADDTSTEPASGTATAAANQPETPEIVIERGDNLWRIARGIYGAGIRYTVIFEANRNQIEDPHLIFPDQVFTIPVLDDDTTAQ